MAAIGYMAVPETKEVDNRQSDVLAKLGMVKSGTGPGLHGSVNSCRFLSFSLWFVLGPGGFREASGGPGKAHG